MTQETHEPSLEEEQDDALAPHTDEEVAHTAIQTNLDDLSLWQLIRRFFYKTATERRQEREWRMQQLDDAIEHQPNAAVNYLLRGELYYEAKQYNLARADFAQAKAFAVVQLEDERFGLAAQAIQDKAERYLQLLS